MSLAGYYTARSVSLAPQTIQIGALSTPIQYVGLDHCGLHVLVSQQLLDGPNIVPILQEVRRKGVPEGVTRGEFGQPSPSHRPLDGPLDDGLMQMMPVPRRCATVHVVRRGGRDPLPKNG